MIFAAIEHWDFWTILTCRVFWCGLGGWIVASLIKMALAWRKTHEVDFTYLVATGGMPSSHSASVSGIACGIGFTNGFDSSVCVLAVCFAIVTMFDAATVRRAAGEHAKVLNAILADLKELKFRPQQRFKELLGHTRKEVFWGLVTGIAWATVLCLIWD